MKSRTLIALCLTAAAPAAADYDDFVKLRTGFIQADVFVGGDPFKSSKKDLDAFFPTSTSTEEVRPARGGVRVGVLGGPYGKVLAGASVGYVSGPRSTLLYTGGGSPFQIGRQTTFLRFLAEVQHRRPLTSNLDLRLRAAAGYARGRLNVDYQTSSFSASGRETWGGFTWEAGPALGWNGRGWSLEVGGMAAGFPSKDPGYTEYAPSSYLYVPRFSWNPWVLQVTLHFEMDGGREKFEAF